MARSRTTRPSTTRRKEPRDADAQVTRDAMIVAAERVLAKFGAAGFTTNHVAEIAGVSIGSVYQYFPNKQAIIATLIERNAAQFGAMFERVLAAHPADAPETVALAIGLGFRELFHAQGKVHFELYEQVPALGLLDLLETTLTRMTDQLAAWLAANPRLAVHEPRAMAWVFVRAVDGIARSFAIAHDGVDEEAIMRHTIGMLLAGVPRVRI